MSLKVSPTKTQVSISAGTSKNMTIFLENASANSKTVTVDFRDTSVDASGTRTLAPKGQTNTSDGMSSYTSGITSFELAAGQRQSYTATITVPANAEPKTRYGGVAFTAAGDSGAVASLVVVTITGASAPAPASTPSQSTPASGSAGQTIPQPTSTVTPTTTQPATTTTTTSDDDKAPASSNVNARFGNQTPLWLSAGALSLIVALAGIYFWRHKRVAPANTPETTVTPPVAPSTTTGPEAATDSPKTSNLDQRQV